MSTQPQSMLFERRFPNEIFAIIIDSLNDDPFSLRNISVVCKDFVVFSQPYLFRHVDLTSKSLAGCTEAAPPNKRRSQFVGILSNPQTSYLGRFVRRLDFPGNIENGSKGAQRDHVPDTLLILQSLPFLTEVRLEKGRFEHFDAIRKHLGGQLQKLWIRGVVLLEIVHFQDFQRLLTSLTELKFLAIDELSNSGNLALDQTALVLPSSLRELHITKMDGAGLWILEISYPPILGTLLVDFDLTSRHGPGLWRSLKPGTAVAIDVNTGLVPNWVMTNTILQVMSVFLRGFNLPYFTLCCSQSPSLAKFFRLFIRSLPYSVRDISIDFNAGATDGPVDQDSSLRDWDALDQTLIQRYEGRSLNRVWFRCTTRMVSWDGPSSAHWHDRSILDRVRKLLPQADKMGIIDVDHGRRFFEF
ncbi:hypothetical protein BT96DRAFT_1015032 [Gymnopus androsaceus JB14]|uniref:F-box domain-containing protein n=1 Tax=Gymnopus androsaceus JB14 TaxID=1447944 RepID=A0A6A4I6X6_9AGAR|nr:hypothetical protein BT96DRAFT_1015032 [Gymnopus androsaceus JB14]